MKSMAIKSQHQTDTKNVLVFFSFFFLFLQLFLRIKSFILLPAALKMDIKPSDALPELICRQVYPVDLHQYSSKSKHWRAEQLKRLVLCGRSNFCSNLAKDQRKIRQNARIWFFGKENLVSEFFSQAKFCSQLSYINCNQVFSLTL